MERNTKQFTSYWRNALADADSGRGALSADEAKKLTLWKDPNNGRLPEDIVRMCFSGEKESVKTVEVTLRPQVWLLQTQHGKRLTGAAPDVVTPLVLSAHLNREGFLLPAAPATLPRDLLEPLPKGVFSIGEMNQYDASLTLQNATKYPVFDDPNLNTETDEEREERQAKYHHHWQKYCKESQALLAEVAGHWLETHEQYQLADYGYIAKENQAGGAGFHILTMYDHLLKSKQEVPLLSRFASSEPCQIAPLLSANAKFTHRLGHSGDKFPLAMAQRDALSHYLTQQPGDILAVNGPPGTGKTTLVLSIIATEWANAALAQSEPPVVIATSTNNQAVTNIIEAFGKDFAEGTGPMAGRWLPDLQSYGAYFPSSRGRAEAAKKYQTEEFFTRVESKEYVATALQHYLEKAQSAFPEHPCQSVKQVIELLHQHLTARSQELHTVTRCWEALQDARQQLASLGSQPAQYLADKRQSLAEQTRETELLTEGLKKWQQYRASESMLLTLFSWIPSIRTRRRYQITLLLEEIFGHRFEKFTGKLPDDVDHQIDQLINQSRKIQADHQQHIESAEQLIQSEQTATQGWHTLCRQLGNTGEKELSLSDADELADIHIRFPAFLLASHYWEGRWLMDMAAIKDLAREKRLNGAKSVQARWQRRMKLTPCVVMTCYMLPASMKTSEFAGQGQPFDKSYFYNLADLLIVDEAGQVLPEVAAASFALAKKALVIGDTEQIAPIWSSTAATDIGNMLEAGILSGDNQEQLIAAYRHVSDSGKSAASGSVMKIAQFASCYQYDPDLARGMYLYEHRRCFDNIIGYCNELCYHGKLQPKRGDDQDTLFPAMGYLHVDGLGQQANSGSRYNALEAETIAAWLAANQQTIENHYKQPLHRLVGVVTPFAAQVGAIKAALAKHNITTGSGEHALTVGTVHSLQGAERALVIFSPVYSKHEDGGFIDSSNSMLNVAVSRAKDSFLVFGDMDLFEIQPASTPRGILAKYLFASESHALTFTLPGRRDLMNSQQQMMTLHGSDQHDQFLNRCLAEVRKSIQIVSPWLIWDRLEQTGFLAAMVSAQSRGVTITVVTDESFNTNDRDEAKRARKRQLLAEAIEKLVALGMTVKLVKRVHSKVVIGDESLLCVGSFNWFSAIRQGEYANYDTSMVYRGDKVNAEIQTLQQSLSKRFK